MNLASLSGRSAVGIPSSCPRFFMLSMVIALQKQIAAEIAALRLLGESTKAVRTGINATGLYWETPNGPVVLFYTGRHHAGEIVDQLVTSRR